MTTKTLIDIRARSYGKPMLVGLVGGVGSRPYPLTASRQASQSDFQKAGLSPSSFNANAVPKPLGPLGKTPLVEPLFRDVLSQCGINDISMCIMYMGDDFKTYFRPNMQRLRKGPGMSQYWDEQRRLNKNLNTAGSVVMGWKKNLLYNPERPQLYVIPSGDIRTKMNFGRMMELHEQHDALASIALAPVPWKDVGRFGTVIREGDQPDVGGKYTGYAGGEFSRILSYIEKSPDAKSNLNSASIYMISDRLLQLIVADQYFTVPAGTPLDPMKTPNIYKVSTDGTQRVRAGVFSNFLVNQGKANVIKGGRLQEVPIVENDANPNFSDWGGHIFPDISNNPDLYKAQNAGDPEGLYGYFELTADTKEPVLWADDGTRHALWQSNMELISESGGIFDGRADFSWWPKPETTVTYDQSGQKIWKGQNTRIEEGAVIVGPVFLGDNVVIKKGAIVDKSVVGSGWVIDGKSKLTRSVLWPDRTTLDLPSLYPSLDYNLRGMILRNTFVGGGFFRENGDMNFRFDDTGEYVYFKSHGSEQLEFGGAMIVSNSAKGNIIVKLR